MAELTRQDYDMLIEAVEAWESRDMMAYMGQIAIAAQAELASGNRDAAEAAIKRMSFEREQEMRTRKDRSVLLRAKLIAIRDSLAADAFLAAAQEHIRSTE